MGRLYLSCSSSLSTPQLLVLQIGNDIDQAVEAMKEQKRQYKEIEQSIFNPENASSDLLSDLLSKLKHQKETLQETRKHIASLYDKGVQVRMGFFFTDATVHITSFNSLV